MTAATTAPATTTQSSTVALINSLLPLLQLVVPGATGTIITAIIVALEAAIPVIVDLAQELMTPVTNIINALRSNSDITPDQLAALKAVEDQLDAAFEAAAERALAEDAADEAAAKSAT